MAVGPANLSHREQFRHGATLLKRLIVSFDRNERRYFVEFQFIPETDSPDTKFRYSGEHNYENVAQVLSSPQILHRRRPGRVLAITIRPGVVYPLNTNKMFATEGLEVNKTVSNPPFNSSTMYLHNKKRRRWAPPVSAGSTRHS